MSLSGGNDENTLLLLHGEDLTDSSPYGVSITNNGVSISNAQSKFGGKSMYFNGSSFLTLLDKALVPSSGDFTFDWWEYRTTVGSEGAVFHQNYGEKTGYGFLIGYILSGALDLFISSAGSSWDVASSISMGTILTNQWVHRAIVRNGSKFSIYQNGSLISSFTSAKTITVNMYPTLGSYGFATNTYFSGYIDEFRISDIARWTANFTPPNEPYKSPAPPSSPDKLEQLLAVRLAWSAVDGATKYNVYRDGSLLTSTTETSYVDATAEENQEYTYAVSAVGSGGESAKTTLTVYTKSGYFLYKPYIESATFQ